MTRRAALPPCHVRLIDLIGVKPVGRPIANENAARWVHPMSPRRGRPGLVPFDAPDLWAAIERGEFPAPTISASGVSWSIEDINRWRQPDVETPPAVSAAGGVKRDSKRNAADSTRRTRRKQPPRRQCACCTYLHTPHEIGAAIQRGIDLFKITRPVCVPCGAKIARQQATFQRERTVR